MFGIDDALFGSVAAPLIGGLLGGSTSGGGGATQRQEMNPNVAKYVYGTDGNSGLLNAANSVFTKQMQSGGLNDMQRQGLDMQYQYLTSPQYSQGYNQMMQMGSALMGGGVAKNPFTSNTGGMPAATRVAAPAMQPFQYSAATQKPVAAPNYNVTPTITAASDSTKDYFAQNPDVAAAYAKDSMGMTPDEFAQAHYQKYGKTEGRKEPKAAASAAGLLSLVDSSI